MLSNTTYYAESLFSNMNSIKLLMKTCSCHERFTPQMNARKTNCSSFLEKEIVDKKSTSSEPKSEDELTFIHHLWGWYNQACFWVLLSLLFCGWSLFLGALIFVPQSRLPGLLYLAWMLYDRETPYNGGRRLAFLRDRAFWQSVRDYFPIKLVKTAELPPDTTYLFSAFPHGLLAFGVVCNFASNVNNFDELFVGLKPHLMTMDQNFDLPLTRDLFLWFGGCACSREGVLNILRGPPGNVSVLVVGGMAEALRTSLGKYTLVLKNRKGFVRLALKAGSSLVPVFSFGETSTYDQISSEWYWWLQGKLKSILNAPFVLPKGRGIFKECISILPFKVPITTVVGKPIKLPKDENPSDEMVDAFHRIFIRELTHLFNEYKGRYDVNGEKATLTIE